MKPKRCPFCGSKPEQRFDGPFTKDNKAWILKHNDDCFLRIIHKTGINFYEAYSEDISLWNMRTIIGG